MSFNRQKFIADLRLLETLEVPWRHQGASIETGMDCIGVVRWGVERQMLLPPELAEEFTHYHRPPDGQRMLAIMRKWLTEITREQLQPADLIVIFNRRNPCHMAVQMPDDLVAEAFESQDGSVSRFMIRTLDPRRRIAACFRIPDFA